MLKVSVKVARYENASHAGVYLGTNRLAMPARASSSVLKH
jgi:hypothetical protein